MSRRKRKLKRKIENNSKELFSTDGSNKIKLQYSISNKNSVSKKRKKNFLKLFQKTVLIIATFIFVLTSFAFTSVVAYLQSRIQGISDPSKVFADIELATEIYDRNGERLYRMYDDNSNSDHFKSDEITNVIKGAFLAAEDDNFYNHKGFDVDAIARCSLKTVNGGDKCGGSTITQQLVKIKTKKTKATIERKIDEVLLATKIEQNYSKDEILEMYLKVTPYGSNMTGIKTAAKFYFGVNNLKDLDLAQAVSLAAIVNEPSKLSPAFANDYEATKQRLKQRENYIYEQLIEKKDLINSQLLQFSVDKKNIITLDLIERAKNENVVFNNPSIEVKAGHFVNYALTQLQQKNFKNGEEPFSLSDLQTGGYKIYTTLDYNLQQIAERYVLSAGNEYKQWNVYNAAVMTTKPSTGEIITMAGSKSFYGESEGCDQYSQNCKYNPEVNVLTSFQSPGSTNKPLGYYIAYEESKLAPGSFLPDIPIALGEYVPKNWDGKYLGINSTTAREMLRKSRNIPAIQVVTAIGVSKYLETARKFGYTTYQQDSNYGPSIILGGADIYLTEHAQAYGVFANGGDFTELNPILKIEDKNGKIIYEANPKKERVADPAAVYLLNQSLYNLETGTGDTIAWDSRDIAGKTGTTEENKDALLVMYSPDFVTIGWAGNNNNEPLDYLFGWPGFVVAPWLKGYMNEIGNTEYFSAKTAFYKPDNVFQGGGDCDSFGKCLGISKDWLIAGREPGRGDTGWSVLGTSTNDNRYSRYYRMLVPELQKYLDAYLYRGGVVN